MSDFSSDINQDYIPQTDQERLEHEHNKKYLKWKSEEDAKAAASTESEAPVEEAEPEEDKGAVYNIGHTAAAIPLGTADFISDVVGLVPWLKPADEWWDENSPRSNHPAHKIIRDASSIIVPTLATGGVVTGGLKAATAA